MRLHHLLALLAPIALSVSVSVSAHASVIVTRVGTGGVPLPSLSGFGSIATFDTIKQTPYGSTTPTGSFTDRDGSWSGTGVVMNTTVKVRWVCMQNRIVTRRIIWLC